MEMHSFTKLMICPMFDTQFLSVHKTYLGRQLQAVPVCLIFNTRKQLPKLTLIPYTNVPQIEVRQFSVRLWHCTWGWKVYFFSRTSSKSVLVRSSGIEVLTTPLTASPSATTLSDHSMGKHVLNLRVDHATSNFNFDANSVGNIWQSALQKAANVQKQSQI